MNDFANAQVRYAFGISEIFKFYDDSISYKISKLFFILILSPVYLTFLIVMEILSSLNIIIGKIPVINFIYSFIISCIESIFMTFPLSIITLPDFKYKEVENTITEHNDINKTTSVPKDKTYQDPIKLDIEPIVINAATLYLHRVTTQNSANGTSSVLETAMSIIPNLTIKNHNAYNPILRTYLQKMHCSIFCAYLVAKNCEIKHIDFSTYKNTDASGKRFLSDEYKIFDKFLLESYEIIENTYNIECNDNFTLSSKMYIDHLNQYFSHDTVLSSNIFVNILANVSNRMTKPLLIKFDESFECNNERDTAYYNFCIDLEERIKSLFDQVKDYYN